jgi:hypothetical protein
LPVASPGPFGMTALFHLLLDSAGLQLFDQGEWDAAKHGRTRRRWRKLHVVIPPRASAAPSTDDADNLNPRDATSGSPTKKPG